MQYQSTLNIIQYQSTLIITQSTFVLQLEIIKDEQISPQITNSDFLTYVLIIMESSKYNCKAWFLPVSHINRQGNKIKKEVSKLVVVQGVGDGNFVQCESSHQS